MTATALQNLSNVPIPWWNGLLVAFCLITVTLCLTKKYNAMTALLAVQGVCLSLLTFSLGAYAKEPHLFVAGSVNLLMKAGLIPWLLRDSLMKSKLWRQKDEHFAAIQAAIWIGVITLITVLVTPQLLEKLTVLSGRTLQMAFAGVFLGLWLMIYRDYLYSQVVGLLLMENSLYLAALALTQGMPLLVELGILFDVFVCVLVMGVLLGRVRHLFETTAIDTLRHLRG